MSSLSHAAQRTILFCMLFAGCAGDDDPHGILGTPTACPECSIETREVWESKPRDANLLGSAWPLEINGELWLMGEMWGAAIGRFPLNNGASSLTVREGDGPGEFRRIARGQEHPAGDTIIAIQNNRVTYLDKDGTEIRSFRHAIPSFRGFVIAADGSLVLAEPRGVGPAGPSGRTLHAFGPDGAYRHSFRDVDPHADSMWPMGPGPEPGTIWVVVPRNTGFSAELWDIDQGRRTESITVSPPWWVPESRTPEEYDQMAGKGATVPRLPTAPVALRDDGEILWVVLRHPDPDHATTLMAGARMDKWWDGVLLAVQRSSGDIMAAAVFDEFLLGFSARGRVLAYDEEVDAHPRARLLDVTLRREH